MGEEQVLEEVASDDLNLCKINAIDVRSRLHPGVTCPAVVGRHAGFLSGVGVRRLERDRRVVKN